MAAEVIATTQQPLHVDPKFWGESYGYWFQSGVLVAAAVLAYMAIRTSRAVERRKAATASLQSGSKDAELVRAVCRIAALHDGETKIGPLAKKENLDADDAKLIRYALNHYEHISVAILYGIYDEAIYKASSFTTIVKLYERTKPFIEEARTFTGSVTTYQELERLACRWKNKPLLHKPVTAIEKRSLIRKLTGS
jgi:hypothetical protein